ncbi:hypothetical protein LTR36_001150 [Oleoguttula mirabilis]|uniref:Ubiquitin-conjugating enzyme E2 2 n=1 Tax=Oleoguttula mirabilis TaxID=1507867 RepID=A0AAV9JQ33_9PEZI|nr:hypothetical protein LTR36_001150 [Oleoguttula mirabilis]
MNSRTLRRLAADHGALHNQPLPPNYLFAPNAADGDDLTQLDILLAGPTHTPFAAGVFKLHLTIPPTYPSEPPTAHFRTPIFHPNVDPQTGGVCVETLKRDWDTKLTLRDILVVIGCLLIQPNPDSALNADAGSLMQEDFATFTRRAELMTSCHAVIPRALRDAVSEAQNRGRENEELEAVEDKVDINEFANGPAAPARRRKLGATARQKGTTASRRSKGSPSGAHTRRRQHVEPTQPFVRQAGGDDVFGDVGTDRSRHERAKSVSDDSSMADANQENDELRSPAKAHTPKVATPRRPHGAPVPLGELTMDEPSSDSDSEMEAEYPPSPRKSPSKSARKQRPQPQPPNGPERAESSRDALRRAPNITPPTHFFTSKPLAEDSPFAPSAAGGLFSPSPRKTRVERRPMGSPGGKPNALPGGLFGANTNTRTPGRNEGGGGGGGIFKPRTPSSSEKKRQEEHRGEALNARLWKLCGGDVERWNRCDFDGEPFGKKASRW